MIKRPKLKNLRIGPKTALAGVVLAATPMVAEFEGLRQYAYFDPVGIPTICYGETQGVKMGQTKTKEECDKLLQGRLGEFAAAVDELVKVPMNTQMHAALTSFAYNVGVKAFGDSTLLRKLNRGDYRGACDQLPRWVYSKGYKLRGLITRREKEREVCLHGINESA